MGTPEELKKAQECFSKIYKSPQMTSSRIHEYAQLLLKNYQLLSKENKGDLDQKTDVDLAYSILTNLKSDYDSKKYQNDWFLNDLGRVCFAKAALIGKGTSKQRDEKIKYFEYAEKYFTEAIKNRPESTIVQLDYIVTKRMLMEQYQMVAEENWSSKESVKTLGLKRNPSIAFDYFQKAEDKAKDGVNINVTKEKINNIDIKQLKQLFQTHIEYYEKNIKSCRKELTVTDDKGIPITDNSGNIITVK